MKNIIIGIGIILFLGGIVVFWLGSMDLTPELTQEQREAKGSMLPDLTLTDYEGKSVRLHDFLGVPMVVNAWAAWCPFCKDELPDFAAVQKEMGDAVRFIAIDRAEPRVVAKKYSDELSVTDDMLFLLDERDTFYRAIGGFSMPETLFVDSSGIIRYHKRGPMAVKEIRERTRGLLAQ